MTRKKVQARAPDYCPNSVASLRLNKHYQRSLGRAEKQEDQ